jgi:hypothetical protein
MHRARTLSPALHRCKLFMHQPQSIKRHFLSFIIGRQQSSSKEKLFHVAHGATNARSPD